MAEVEVMSKSNVQTLQKNVGTMLNNKKYSDTVFLVNNNQFYASSHLVSVSSKAFDSLLTDHFNNCADKIIKISNVKHDDSFHILLKSMYGIEIDYTQTDKAVLCEVLHLCETYELTNFSEDIQAYLSQLECFELESVVALLNTAKKFNVTELYDKLTVYAYQNTDQLVKHVSFVDLQFDVLVDLIQSDWFCLSEIDILTGVLSWHNDMAKSGSNKQVSRNKNGRGSNFEKKYVSSDDQSDASSYKTDQAESIHTSDKTNPNKNIPDGGIATSDEKSIQLVKSFRENVLKSLLAHIRGPNISVVDYLKAFETELYDKYRDTLLDHKLFSQKSDPRKTKSQLLQKQNLKTRFQLSQQQNNTTGAETKSQQFWKRRNLDCFSNKLTQLSQ
ncbi:hypothetical protein M8J76_007681 [Diaphorina citri]|nr:hypothetical protein M8J76_007681 [Diaphorina citri]